MGFSFWRICCYQDFQQQIFRFSESWGLFCCEAVSIEWFGRGIFESSKSQLFLREIPSLQSNFFPAKILFSKYKRKIWREKNLFCKWTILQNKKAPTIIKRKKWKVLLLTTPQHHNSKINPISKTKTRKILLIIKSEIYFLFCGFQLFIKNLPKVTFHNKFCVSGGFSSFSFFFFSWWQMLPKFGFFEGFLL